MVDKQLSALQFYSGVYISATQQSVQGLKAIMKSKHCKKIYARGSGVNDTLAFERYALELSRFAVQRQRLGKK